MERRHKDRVSAALVAASAREIAKACGVDTSTVYRWQQIPARHLATVARVTGIDKHRLRPDLIEEGEDGR